MDAFFTMLTAFLTTYGPTIATVYAVFLGLFVLCFAAVFIMVLRTFWTISKRMDKF